MPQPTRGMVHIDRALTNISVAYIQSPNAFIADKVFPTVPVQKQSDRYFVYLKEDWFRDEATERAPATESSGGMYEIDNTPNYFCKKYAFHRDITEEDRANQDEPLNVDVDSAEFVTQKMLLKREVVWANSYFTITAGGAGDRESAWGANVVGGTMSGVDTTADPHHFLQWDRNGSTPIEDISAAKVRMASQTGFMPNTLVLGAKVYETLRNHDDILGRIVFTQRGYVTADILAQLFDVERIIVGWAVQNTANKGATEATDFLLGNHALLAYAAPRPALKTPSAGYTFAWNGLMGAGAFGNRILRIPMPMLGVGTERIEGEMAFDLQVVAQDLGIFFADAVQ